MQQQSELPQTVRRTVYFLLKKKEEKKPHRNKSTKAEWNNVNNREFPNKQFFQYTVDVKTELRVIIIPFNSELSTPPPPVWHFFLVRSHWWLKIKGRREEKIILLPTFSEFPIISKPISTPVSRVREKESSKHFSFTSTKYLYSATTNKRRKNEKI